MPSPSAEDHSPKARLLPRSNVSTAGLLFMLSRSARVSPRRRRASCFGMASREDLLSVGLSWQRRWPPGTDKEMAELTHWSLGGGEEEQGCHPAVCVAG